MKLATALVLASLMAPIHQNHPTGPVAVKVCGPEDWGPHAHPRARLYHRHFLSGRSVFTRSDAPIRSRLPRDR